MSEQNKNLQRVARTRARLDNVDIELKKADGTKFASMAELAQSDDFGMSMYGTIDMGNFADLRYMKLSTELSEYLTISDDALVNMRKLNADKAALQANLDAVELAASDDRAAIRGELGVEEAARIAKDAEERAFALAARTLNESNRDDAIAAAKIIDDAALAALQTEVDQNKSDADTAISAEEARAMAAESVVANNLTAYETSNDAAVGVERGRIDTLLSGSSVDFDTLLEITSAYQLADVSVIASIVALQADVDQNKSDSDSGLTAISGSLVTETARAVAAEAVLTADLASETARAGGIEAGIQAALDVQEAKEAAYEVSNDAALAAEESRALLAESTLDGKVDTEIADRIQAVQDLHDIIDADMIAEETVRAAADQLNAANFLAEQQATSTDRALIRSEIAAAKIIDDAALAALQLEVDGNELDGDNDRAAIRSEIAAAKIIDDAALAAEEARAMAAESVVANNLTAYETSNDAAVGVERGRIDTLLSGSSVDFDTLLEITSAYQLADVSVIASIVALQADVDQNKSDSDSGLTAISGSLVTETARAVAAEAVLTADLASETARAGGIEAGIQAALDVQEAKEAAYEVSNDAALAAEESRALLAEGGLGGRLDIVEGSVNQAGSVAKAEFDAKAYADTQIAAQEVQSAAARLVVQTDVDNNETTMISEFSAVRGELAQEVSGILGGASASHDTMKKIEDLMIADAASASADLVAEASLARAEEAKLAADVLALHGRHDEYEQIMVSDFEAGAFSLAAASFNAPMSDIMSVHVNGFKLMSDEFTVSEMEGAMDSIVFHVPMYVGDAVSVSGMKKITLQS